MPKAVEAKLQEVEPTFKRVAETVAPLFDALTPAHLLDHMIMEYRLGLPDPSVQAANAARGWTALELALRCLVTWMERVHPVAKQEMGSNQRAQKRRRSTKGTVAAHT